MPLSPELVEEYFQRIQFPPLPQVTAALIEIAGDPRSSASDVAAVVNADPVLTTRLLKVANSSFFAQREKVATIERATVVLGLDYIKAVALAAQLSGALVKVQCKGLDMDSFWRDSLLRGCMARQLANAAQIPVPERAFIVGLTQDFAIPALANRHGAIYIKNYGRFRETQCVLHEWEQRVLRYTHAAIAEAILRSWNLPEILTDPVGRHHAIPTEDSQEQVDPTTLQLWAIAAFVGTLPLGATEAATDRRLHQSAMHIATQLLGVDAAEVGDVLRRASAEFETIRTLFEEMLPEKCDVGNLVKQTCRLLADVDPKLVDATFS